MRHRILIFFPIAITVICLYVAGYFRFDDEAVPSVANVAEERNSASSVANVAEQRQRWHVPAPLNASLGFGKIYYVSLASYVCHDFMLIVDGRRGRII